MIEVTFDSIRVSLLSQNRIVVLKEEHSERFLPIWIGPFEADAITLQLQGMEAPRPLTHDLLKSVIETLGGEVLHIVISSLERNTYFARIVLDVNGDTMEIDSRPSDAIALAVRVSAPIYVAEEVMEQAGMMPEEEMSLSEEGSGQRGIWRHLPRRPGRVSRTLSKAWTWTACSATRRSPSPPRSKRRGCIRQLRRFCRFYPSGTLVLRTLSLRRVRRENAENFSVVSL
jgi:bifunctional DNase/RNase